MGILVQVDSILSQPILEEKEKRKISQPKNLWTMKEGANRWIGQVLTEEATGIGIRTGVEVKESGHSRAVALEKGGTDQRQDHYGDSHPQ